jgi:serine phosphatase RsbU (regulator of sigma subunit)
VGGVTEALKGFVGTAPQSDDITMLALRWLHAAAL